MKLLLDKTEAAAALSISESTLQRLVKDGKIKQSRIGTRALFKTADLEEFVEKLSAGEFAEKKRGRPRLAI